jgi:hypothetical protein
MKGDFIMRIKVADFVKLLEDARYDKDTELIFGAYGGEELFELSPEGIDDGYFVEREEERFNPNNEIYVTLKLNRALVKAEVDYKMVEFEDDMRDAFNKTFVEHFINE